MIADAEEKGIIKPGEVSYSRLVFLALDVHVVIEM